MSFKISKENIVVDEISKKTATLFYIELISFDDIKDLVEQNIVRMRFGSDDYEVKEAKNRIKIFLSGKDDNGKKAAISEFLVTLILINNGYKQQFIFTNLEDNSFKKGFDGVFRAEDEEMWIMECKSTSSLTHKDKIIEATKCINDKITNSKNDPWENALYHLRALDGKYKSQKILDKIKILSKDFGSKINHSLSEFNIIPSSIRWFLPKPKINDLKVELANVKDCKEPKNVIFVCVDSTIFLDFTKYLES